MPAKASDATHVWWQTSVHQEKPGPVYPRRRNRWFVLSPRTSIIDDSVSNRPTPSTVIAWLMPWEALPSPRGRSRQDSVANPFLFPGFCPKGSFYLSLSIGFLTCNTAKKSVDQISVISVWVVDDNLPRKLFFFPPPYHAQPCPTPANSEVTAGGASDVNILLSSSPAHSNGQPELG